MSSLYPTFSSSPPSLPPHVFLFGAAAAGHFIPLTRIARILDSHHYQVTLCTSSFYWKPALLASLPSSIRILQLQDGVPENIKELPTPPFMALHNYMFSPLKKAIKELPSKPDLIISDLFSFSGSFAAEELGIPCICNYPGNLVLYNWIFHIPTFFLPKPLREMLYKIRDRLTKHYILVDSFWGLDIAQSLPPSVQLIGTLGSFETNNGNSEIKATDNWNSYPEIKTWLEQNNNPVVFLTTGSHVELTEKQVQIFYEGLYCDEKKVYADGKKWRFIWSLQNKYLQHLPNDLKERKDKDGNLLIVPWVPQVEVLNHVNVKVVLTHCGWGGVSEVISSGKPIVAVPFAHDQPSNAVLLTKFGVGVHLDVNKFNASQLRSAVAEVLNNPSYGIKMQELQKIESIASKSTSNKIIEAVEYVRHFGVKYVLVKKESSWKKRVLLFLALKGVLGFILFFVGRNRFHRRTN